MEKVCPRCSAKFHCYGDQDCWCEDAQVHRKDLIIIMDKYDDCLCPSCLNKYSEK